MLSRSLHATQPPASGRSLFVRAAAMKPCDAGSTLRHPGPPEAASA